jgi:hypothetical protein
MKKNGIKAAALIIGLPLFLLSCEKEAPEGGSGKKVTIDFAVSNGDYGSNQSITRSEKGGDLKPETVYIPLDDDYFLSATLRPEPAEETDEVRATTAFKNGQKIYFAVYTDVGTSPLDEAIYTWNGSRFVPDGDPLGVEPDNGMVYHFVAYSFFGDPTTEPSDTEIEPWQDLVWGKQDTEIHDNETSRRVEILMQHKFSRVRVKVDASTVVSAITGGSSVFHDARDVEIEGGTKADFSSMRAGTLVSSSASGSEVTETFGNAGWTNPTNTSTLSPYKVFFPSLTKVNIGMLRFGHSGQVTYNDLSATFTQTLAESTNYTVEVNVRMRRWAYSNVYWVSTGWGSGYMTFDRTLVDASHQYYQGVFFKHGSLVGISPRYVYVYVDDAPEPTTLYLPPSSGTDWISYYTSDDLAALWPEGEGDHIPYLSGDVSGFDTYTGDICTRIDNAWRLPNYTECGVDADFGPFGNGNSSNPVDAAGTSLFTGGVTYNSAFGITFFPASGQKYYYDGVFSVVNMASDTHYRTGSSSPYEGYVSVLRASGSSDGLYSSDEPTVCHPVRCVKKLPAE